MLPEVIMNTLYLSYDGMTDNLGQSQVIPYLAGLSAKGYATTLVSFEKEERFAANREKISKLLQQHNIKWQPLNYTKKPPILSTLWDVYRLRKVVERLHKKNNFKIVHCRSYITSLVGEYMKKRYGTKFIFDMRAFYADERVDGKLWNMDKWVFKKVYEYFKRKETDFLNIADHTITLTQKARDIIHTWKQIKSQPIPIEVIPCCADLEHFKRESINELWAQKFRKDLGISQNDFVLSYLGSIGTWYLLEEMLDFFVVLQEQKPEAKFLFITSEDPEYVKKAASDRGIAEDRLVIVYGKREEVPTLISLSQLSIFFIQPYFSKQGSSPTKHGEILGMGIPVVCNAGVGDVDEIVESTRSGILVKELNKTAYQKAVEEIDELLQKEPSLFRNAAFKYYSLKEGVEKYSKVYKLLTEASAL